MSTSAFGQTTFSERLRCPQKRFRLEGLRLGGDGESRSCAILERFFRELGRSWWGGSPDFPGIELPGQLPSVAAAGTWVRIGGSAGERPLNIPHLGGKTGLNMRQAPHRLQAKLADFRDLVGRSVGLRGELAQVQYLRGFPPRRKFTYMSLSEVGPTGLNGD